MNSNYLLTPEHLDGQIPRIADLDTRLKIWHTIHMKRTNLVLNTELLREAQSLLEERTYSATVNRALAEAIRLAKVRKLGAFFGTGIWEGNLSQMREDRRGRRRVS